MRAAALGDWSPTQEVEIPNPNAKKEKDGANCGQSSSCVTRTATEIKINDLDRHQRNPRRRAHNCVTLISYFNVSPRGGLVGAQVAAPQSLNRRQAAVTLMGALGRHLHGPPWVTACTSVFGDSLSRRGVR